MIVESGRVTRVSGRHVWVSSDSQQACQRCAQGVGCGGALMNHLLGSRLSVVRALPLGELSVDQLVDIKLAESALLKAAMMTYLIPLSGLLLGALLGFLFSPSGDIGTLTGASFGFAISFLLLRWIDVRVLLKPEYQPVAMRRYSDTF